MRQKEAQEHRQAIEKGKIMAKSWQDVVSEQIKPQIKDVHHEIVWWIEKELTLDQWIELDDRQAQVFVDMGLEDNFSGYAGPIPEIGNEDAEEKT